MSENTKKKDLPKRITPGPIKPARKALRDNPLFRKETRGVVSELMSVTPQEYDFALSHPRDEASEHGETFGSNYFPEVLPRIDSKLGPVPDTPFENSSEEPLESKTSQIQLATPTNKKLATSSTNQLTTPQKTSQPQLATPLTPGLLTPSVASQQATGLPSVASQQATHQTSKLATNPKPQLARREHQKLSYEERGLTTVATRYPKELITRINSICHELNIEKQSFFQLVASYALDLPLSELATLLGVPVASQLAHDDKRIFKTCEDIIMRYQEMTLQKWTRRDDRDAYQYNDTDLRLIDIALITTIANKLKGNTAKVPIKSFSYFKTELDILLQQERHNELPATLNEYHRYTKSIWEKRIKPLRDEKWRG